MNIKSKNQSVEIRRVKMENEVIYIIPKQIDRPIKIVYEYGQCPNCGNDLIDLGKCAISENGNDIDYFDRRHCLYCQNDWFLNGEGIIEFDMDNKKMIYTNKDKRIEFDLVPVNKD
jgi:hypothetical protein